MANRIFFVFIFAVFGTIVQSKRILFYEQNPGCNIVECNDTHVVHITSEVDDDKNQSTYHNLWIFTNDYKPTIILFETEPKAKLSIDWLKFFQHENNSIIFKNGSVLNSFGVEFTDLFIANMTSKQLLYNIPIDHLNWSVNFTEPRDNQSSIRAIFSNENSSIGNFRFHLKSSAHSGREQLLPKLIYSNAGNLLQFEINDLFIPESIKQNNTRLQLCANLTTILDGHRLNSQIEKFTGMDDEYTPGVFQRYLYQMETIDKVDNNNQTRSSFIGWKPVAYFDHKQQIATSLKVISPSIENMTTIPLSSSALNGYFQSPTSSYTINKLANFRFNSEDDNEFDLTINGTSIEFSLSLSLIALSETQFSTSMTIIIVCILIGFGLPFILLIGFIMFTMSKRLLSLFVGSGSNNNYNLQHNSESSG
ncbi:hypothetical protein HUG17_6705 [Dermatophagoides farinae]|uniref:Uncharacterized protein n=1 Tax=Dermatophagoides farinae TaxID=6954 RepID=A0A9D4P580_DERFA|nr:glycosylated lysosomal membrane protein B-like [Dermatophagoides farinae]KAH7644343.1 hypothetical protein HUG17_6705 [Dermatophagoides farinae]